MGLVFAALGTFFYGVTSVVARRGGDDVERQRGLIISVTVNALFNLVWTAGRLLLPGQVGFSGWGLLCFSLAGALTAFIGRGLWFRSIELIGPSRASAIKNTQPLLTVSFAFFFLHEVITLWGVAGAALIVGAIALLGQEQHSARRGGLSMAGLWWGLAAACSFAVGNIFRKLGVSLWPEPVLGATIGTLVAALGVWATPRGWAEGRRLLKARWGSGEWFYAVTGLLFSVAQQMLFQALHRSPVWQVNSVLASEPVIALLFARIFLGRREVVTGRLIVAIAMVFGGLILLTAI